MACSYGIVIGNVFIEYFDPHVVSDVFNVDIESLIPNRLLTGVVFHCSLEAFLSILNDTEGIHLAKEFSVTSKSSLYNSETQFS